MKDGTHVSPTNDARPLRHRELDPSLGRWTRQDPLGYVDGSNSYCALRSNPLLYLDPTGLQPPPETEVHQPGTIIVHDVPGGKRAVGVIRVDVGGTIFDIEVAVEHITTDAGPGVGIRPPRVVADDRGTLERIRDGIGASLPGVSINIETGEIHGWYPLHIQERGIVRIGIRIGDGVVLTPGVPAPGGGGVVLEGASVEVADPDADKIVVVTIPVPPLP